MGLPESEFTALRDKFLANARGCVLTGPMETQQPAKRHKYGVAPKEERTVGNLTFASKAEADAYQQLLAAKCAGEIVGEIELQPEFKFPMGFAYRADFAVTWKDTGREVIDVKGVETPVFKLKAKCMAHFYPDVKLTLWTSAGGKGKGRA